MDMDVAIQGWYMVVFLWGLACGWALVKGLSHA